MAGWLHRVPKPESLYHIWQFGWAVGGVCLLWRSRRTLKADTDGRVGWSGNPTAIAVFFLVYMLAAFLVLPNVAFSLAKTLAELEPELPGFQKALMTFLLPAFSAVFLLALRWFMPEFSPGRPHRVKPAGDFGFTPAGLVRSFAGLMALVTVASLFWNGVLYSLKKAGVGDFAEPQELVRFLISTGGEWKLLLPFAAGAVIFAPVNEELFYRAGVFAILRQHKHRMLAYLICGVIFGAVHGSVFAFFPLAVFGAWLSFLYDTTADLRVPIATHAFFNLSTVVWALLAPGAIPK